MTMLVSSRISSSSSVSGSITVGRRPAPGSPLPRPAADERSISVNTVLVGLVAKLVTAYDLDELEQDVAQLVLFGRDGASMARRLGMSEAVVRWELHRLFEKVGVSSRKGLMHVALRLAAYEGQPAPRGEGEGESPAARRSAPTTPAPRPGSRRQRVLRAVVGGWRVPSSTRVCA